MEITETRIDRFRFAYGIGEAVEGDLICFNKEIGVDECEPERGFRTYKPNGETYYILVSLYTGQERLAAGHIGCLKIDVEGYEDISDECEAVVTSTSIRRTPDEGDEGLFEDDGSPKLIQKLTVTR